MRERSTEPPPARLGYRARLHKLASGGMGTAGVVLFPRVWSVLTQWLIAATVGTAALTDYLTTTTRGAAAVSLVAGALAPVLILRRGALRTAAGRSLIGAAMLVMALVAFGLTFAFEAVFGLGMHAGVFTAAFAAMTILGGPAIVAWPVWHASDRYLVIVGMMVLALVAATGLALLGNARLAAVFVGLGSAIPLLAMTGRTRLSRASRYAVSVARRSIPVSSMSFATALVYPLSLQRGTTLFGGALVGQQLLYWPLVIAMGIASQSIATRAIAAAANDEAADAVAVRGLGRWLESAVVLSFVAALAYVAFRWSLSSPGTAAPLPAGMVVAAAAFIFSDPICIYFCPPSGWRTVAIGSVAASLLVGTAVFVWPSFMIEHFSVCGPSAIVAALRLVFVRHRPLRRTAHVVLGALVAGFVLSMFVR